MRFLLKVFLFIVVALVGVGFYLGSDFYESGRLKERMELELGVSLVGKPQIVDRETYGWAEEGGDISLLRLNGSDCSSVLKVVTQSGTVFERSRCFDLFKRNGVSPAEVNVWRESGWLEYDVSYSVLVDDCLVVREAHFE